MTDRFATLRRGLVGAWCPSLDGIGTVIPDRGNRRNNLSNAAPRGTMQRGGYGIYISGTDNAAIATNANLQRVMASATTATLTGWLRRLTTSSHLSFGFDGAGSGGGNRFAVIWFTDSVLYCSVESGGAQSRVQATSVSDAWTHVALTFDGSAAAASRATLCLNGAVQSTTSFGTIPAALSASLGTFCLGRDTTVRLSTAGAAGWIDDARLYDRVLTLSEIKLLASQRGIGLVPTRHRRANTLAAAATNVWLNVGGVWKTSTPHINVGGVWKQANPKIRVSGTWKG